MVELKQFDNDLSLQADTQWKSEIIDILDDDENAAFYVNDILEIISLAQKHSEIEDCSSYFLVNDGMISAVIKMSHALKGSANYLKFLDIDLAPQFNKEINIEVDIIKIAEVFVQAIMKTVELTYLTNAKRLKIYGRSSYMIDMFDFIVGKQPAKHKGRFSKEGNWLVLTVL